MECGYRDKKRRGVVGDFPDAARGRGRNSGGAVQRPFNNTFKNIFGNSALNMFIGCRIDNVKEIVLTNSTATTISPGTVISYDVVRYRSTLHYGGSVISPQMAPGASVRFGGEQSSSCTAWYRRPAVLAPQ